MSDARVRLARLREEARAGLQGAAGGAAVCAFTRAGTPVPGIKYHEGRWAALTEVDRRCRRTQEDTLAVAAGIRADWADQLERLRARQAGPDWIAYREGGLDALADLEQDAEPDQRA